MFKKLLDLIRFFSSLPHQIEDLRLAIGRLENRMHQIRPGKAISDFEFQVSSQNGEDGIIQYLIAHVAIKNKRFIEFGVHDYQESNTRFLLQNDNWEGLIIDGSSKNINRIKSSRLYWMRNLKAVHSFVTRENIDKLLVNHGFAGDIGLLSIDIDGNDYWVWDAITSTNPRIVIVEYNGLYGSAATVTTPYQADFSYSTAHYSGLYWGASLAAFHRLATAKGYSLVTCNSAGNNAFFVRNDAMGNLVPATPTEAYVKPQFRISRGLRGELSVLDFEKSKELICDLPLINVIDDSRTTIREYEDMGTMT